MVNICIREYAEGGDWDIVTRIDGVDLTAPVEGVRFNDEKLWIHQGGDIKEVCLASNWEVVVC